MILISALPRRPPRSGVEVPAGRQMALLRWALREPPYSLRTMLLSVNNNGATPMHAAAHFGNGAALEELLSAAKATSCSLELIRTFSNKGTGATGDFKLAPLYCRGDPGL